MHVFFFPKVWLKRIWDLDACLFLVSVVEVAWRYVGAAAAFSLGRQTCCGLVLIVESMPLNRVVVKIPDRFWRSWLKYSLAGRAQWIGSIVPCSWDPLHPGLWFLYSLSKLLWPKGREEESPHCNFSTEGDSDLFPTYGCRRRALSSVVSHAILLAAPRGGPYWSMIRKQT